MTQAKQRFLSFDEYLSYDDGTENLYELFNGELIQVPPESGFNVEIATFLLIQFASILDFQRVRGHGLKLKDAIQSPLFGTLNFTPIQIFAAAE